MSNSPNNTLLSKMGFSDADKRMPAHDEACLSIASGPRAILSLLGLKDEIDAVDLEFPLSKGSGQYKTTVGFIDVVIRSSSDSIVIEVKTRIDSIGELLRQMNLYRSYSDPFFESPQHFGKYVIWSLDPADARLASVLHSQGYILLVGPIGAVTRPLVAV